MSYLSDDEHRILLAALRREKEFCSRQLTGSKECVKIVQSLERKFYYNRFEKEIRDKAIEEFVKEALKQFTEFDLKHGYPTVADCEMILKDVSEQMNRRVAE